MIARGAAIAIAAIATAHATAGCDRRAHVASCANSLQAEWRAGDDRRWMLIDNGAVVEAYPMFDDSAGSGDVFHAPRLLDLHREGAGLVGTLLRRSMRGGDACEARIAVHVEACHDDALDVVIADPAPPLAFAPCRWPAPLPSRIEHWRRE